MYQQRYSKSRGRFKTRSYSINPVGILIFITKILCYGVLLFAPFIFWDVLNLDNMIGQYKAFFFTGAYILMAQDFIRHPSQYVLRGEPWNERIFIRRTTCEEDDDYGDGSNWSSK